MRLAGQADLPITPILSADWPRPSRPPLHAVLANQPRPALGIALRPWQEALAEYVATLTPVPEAPCPQLARQHHHPELQRDAFPRHLPDALRGADLSPRPDRDHPRGRRVDRRLGGVSSRSIIPRFKVVAAGAQQRAGGRLQRRRAGMPRGDLLVMLNNDTEVEPGWLAALVEAAEAHPEAGVDRQQDAALRPPRHAAQRGRRDGCGRHPAQPRRVAGGQRAVRRRPVYLRRVRRRASLIAVQAWERPAALTSGCSCTWRTSTWRGGCNCSAGTPSLRPRPGCITT